MNYAYKVGLCILNLVKSLPDNFWFELALLHKLSDNCYLTKTSTLKYYNGMYPYIPLY